MDTKRLTLLAFPLLLTGCITPPDQGGKTPQPPTEAEIKAAIDLRPASLPELLPAFLGTQGTFETQTRPEFKVGQAVYLASRLDRANPKPPAAGQITAAGRVKVNLPSSPDLTQGEKLTPLGFARKFIIADICALDTLQFEAKQENVNLTQYNVLALRPELALMPKTVGGGDQIAGVPENGLLFVTSPAPDYLRVLPYLAVDTITKSEVRSQLVYADADLRVKGELRCASKWVAQLETSQQRNLRINLELRKGWNSIRTTSQPILPKGKLNIQQITVTGQAEAFTAAP